MSERWLRYRVFTKEPGMQLEIADINDPADAKSIAAGRAPGMEIVVIDSNNNQVVATYPTGKTDVPDTV